jgi:hypothetical protein
MYHHGPRLPGPDAADGRCATAADPGMWQKEALGFAGPWLRKSVLLMRASIDADF